MMRWLRDSHFKVTMEAMEVETRRIVIFYLRLLSSVLQIGVYIIVSDQKIRRIGALTQE